MNAAILDEPARDEKGAVALEHDLQKHLPALARFNSTAELERSALYRKLRPQIERVLNSIAQENFAPKVSLEASSSAIRATAWNIERGKQFDKILRALKEHPEISRSDLFLLTELDYGMARTENRFVAREIAEALRLNYVFAPCYLSLVKGSGVEAETEGENTHALHGNALFSRHRIKRAHSFALPNGIDKMRGKEKRLGCQRAVIADIQHPRGEFRAVSLHLDAHSKRAHRRLQMRLLLDHLATLQPQPPTLIGGDWNTTTYNSNSATRAILGYCRRVMMGVGNVLQNHYPYPENFFERELFLELERRGYDFRNLNELGVCTLHYDVSDRAVNVNLGDWVPAWCFPFIRWALKKYEGKCSVKLDWFAGRGIAPDENNPPRVIADLRDADGAPFSDHDAILLDFDLKN